MDTGRTQTALCPNCQSESYRAIYYGLPVRLCKDMDRCATLWAHWTYGWLLALLPFNGWFMAYEGSYWRALWVWGTARWEE